MAPPQASSLQSIMNDLLTSVDIAVGKRPAESASVVSKRPVESASDVGKRPVESASVVIP
jgi:hypothetical protein